MFLPENNLLSETDSPVETDAGDRFERNAPPNSIELVREVYRRYQRHDLRGVLAAFSADVEITQTLELPWGGRFCGHAGAREYFLRMSRHTSALPDPFIHVPAGDDVVVLGRLRGRARASGEEIDVVVVHLWTIHDGKIARLAVFADTPAMREALGA